ncbi:hypothetical protein AKH20_04630, partial [Pelagibacteraceae bacterium GOM-A3]
TNSNPDGIDFPIPGNDDARRSIDLYCSLLKETILNAKKEAPQPTSDEKIDSLIEEKNIDTSKIENSKEVKAETQLN